MIFNPTHPNPPQPNPTLFHIETKQFKKQDIFSAHKVVEVSNLPRNVIFNILSRLPTKSLLLLRCVSKSCNTIISHPHFIKLRLSRHPSTTTPGGDNGDHSLFFYYESIDYMKECYSLRCATTFSESLKLEIPFKSVNGYLRIVGSIKGLICLFDTNYFTNIGTIIFWNPNIRRFKIIPDSLLFTKYDHRFSHMVIGFGFISKINDFKVVQILYDLDSEDNPDPNVFVYTLGDNSWRKIEAIVPCSIPKCWSNNVFVGNSVNWMGKNRPKGEDVYDSIMAFNLEDEVFWVMELPDKREVKCNQVWLSSSVSGESLSLFVRFRNGNGDRLEIWSMREYGVSNSWTKQFNIVANSQISLPLGFMNNGEVLIVVDKGEQLVSYDHKNQEVKDLEVCGVPNSFRVVRHVPSLALLDCGEKFMK